MASEIHDSAGTVGDPQHWLNEDHFPWLRVYPSHVDWSDEFAPRFLPDLFDEAAIKYPDNICTYFLGKTLDYSRIQAMTDEVAAGLQALGVKKGDRIGLFLPNSPTYIVFYFGILKAGGIVVNFNPLYSVEELEYQVEDSGTRLMITLDLKLLFDKVEPLLKMGRLEQAVVCSFANLLPSAKSVLFRLLKGGDLAKVDKSPQRSQIISEEDLLSAGRDYHRHDVDPENDIAVLQYTGGTTGTPKGAMLTHANISINQQQIMAWQNQLAEGEETIMGILPFFHVFAMTTVMNLGVCSGSRIILIPKFELDEGLKIINKLKPTCMPGVPTLYNAMIHHPKLTNYDLSSLKFCISGGAALPIEVKRKFEELTGCHLVEGYGLSETSPVATCNPVSGPVKDGSIGIPFPATRITIRSVDDISEEMPLYEKGEICISGPQVMKGYWNKPDETAASFVGEFFRTGDVGYMDDEGFIFIVDRIKDLIITSGFNIYPRRIEDAIYEFPATAETIVLGIPHEERGEVPKAYIKLKPGQSATQDEILEFLRPKLSKLELPHVIEFRDELPKTMVGKLSKKHLRDEMKEEAQSNG